MKRAILFAALVSLSTAVCAQSPAPEAALAQEGTTAAAETLTTGDDGANRMTVPVMVNGQGPFQFIIDTGADRSVISRELAEQLKLPFAKKMGRLVSMGGVNDVRLATIASLRVSPNRELKHVEAPALLRKNLGADGLLGLDALKDQRILIDFVGQTMTIEPGNSKAVRDEPVSRDTIVVRARSRLGQLVLVDADANGQEVWVVVDTGGQNSVANTAFRKLILTGKQASTLRTVELLSVVGDRIPADYTIIGKMRVGGVMMGNAAVAFVDAHPFKRFGLMRRPAMLLGIDTLRGFRSVSIDFANKQVRFQMPSGSGATAASR